MPCRGLLFVLRVVAVTTGVVLVLPVAFAAAAALAHNFVAVVAWIVLAKPGRRRSGAMVIGIAGALALAMLVGPHIAGQAAFLDKIYLELVVLGARLARRPR